jgi:hypothetical protein
VRFCSVIVPNSYRRTAVKQLFGAAGKGCWLLAVVCLTLGLLAVPVGEAKADEGEYGVCLPLLCNDPLCVLPEDNPACPNADCYRNLPGYGGCAGCTCKGIREGGVVVDCDCKGL